MKRAVSVSLGSSKRNKKVTVTFKDETVSIERIGTNGDAQEARRLYRELDGHVDAFGMGGVDLDLYLDQRVYPLHAAHKLIQDVQQTPVVDGSRLKHTLERRVFALAQPQLGERPHFRKAFIPMGLDRQGLAQAVLEIVDEITFGDLMFGLGLPIPIRGMPRFRLILRMMLPLVSYFPLSMLFYGSKSLENEPKYERYWQAADLIAGDFTFIKKYMPHNLQGKVMITNTTTAENVELLRQVGVKRIITTTPRYDGRSFGTNMMEAALTAYAGLGRRLSRAEINVLIDELDLRPTVQDL